MKKLTSKRNERYINNILSDLKIIWLKQKNLRLGQLINNLGDTEDIDVYYMEDMYLINSLRDLYKL